MRTLFAALCVLLLWTSFAGATPQIAVRSADNCGTCHVDPIDWENPALDQRKCSLNCTTCHVVPTGGGMRNESGLYYGQVTLPTWLKRDVPPVEYHRPALDAPTTQPEDDPAQPAQTTTSGQPPDGAEPPQQQPTIAQPPQNGGQESTRAQSI